MENLYETDYYGWLNQQIRLLNAGQLSKADIQNIAEEMGDMGKKLLRELESRLKILLMHLLKWQYQPDRRSTSWQLTIKVQRRDLVRLLEKNPSLKARIQDTLPLAYEDARTEAAIETGMLEDHFPPSCLWSFDEIMDFEFWPEQWTDS